MERLKNREGNAVILACVVVLIFMIIFTAISEYMRLKIIAKGVRDGVGSSVISVVTNNWDNNYNGLRQGYSGGYILCGDSWEINIDEGAVYQDLSDHLGLQRDGSRYVKYIDDEMEYALYDLDVDIINARFRGDKNDRFKAKVYITLSVPLSFGWNTLPDMVIPLKVEAKFIPKF